MVKRIRKISRDSNSSNKNKFTPEQEAEVNALVKFFKGKGFKRSSEISKYIRDNKLGKKFPNISGILQMSDNEGNAWNFEGGIAPAFYREICLRLELNDNGSYAHVDGFTSYKNIIK